MSTASRLSPKPLRFVPYDPGKKKPRRSRKNTGEASAAALPGSSTQTTTSKTTTVDVQPVATERLPPTTIHHPTQDAGMTGSVVLEEEYDGLIATPGTDSVGEWYQALGFDFLPQPHSRLEEQRTTQDAAAMALPNDRQDSFLHRDTTRPTMNAYTTLPKTLDATHLDSVGQPYILDHLHSWKDLMRESSNNRSQIPETPSQRPPTFSIPVFRWFGNTSIAPGIVKTQARIKQLDRKRAANNDASSPATEYMEKGADGKVGLFDSQDATYPSTVALNHLLEVFITHFMCHFPFLDRDELRRANQSRALSKGLVNSICALASRFSDQPSFLDPDGHPDFSICDSYSDAAKQALLPLLAIPTLEVLQSYILLTWSEWGNGRDAGFWMYTGICVRMAQDLGLAIGSRGRTEVELDADSMVAQQKAELTFWAVFFLDRVVSYGTGRRVTLSEEDIQIPLPHSSIGGVPYAEVPRNPWFAMIRILRYRGMVGDIINAKEMKGTESASLSFLQREMADYYRSLPPSLQFTPKNFELYSHTNQTSTFTLIHLLFHATIILLHRPSLLQASDANINFALIGTLHERSKEISRSSARSIADILHYVELLGPSRAIYCNLFVDHAIFLTAMSFLADLADEPQDTDSMLSILADTQFQRCRAALRKLASYWGGTEFVCGVVDQRSAGLTGGAVHSLEARNPRPIVVEYALDRLPGGFLPSISMTRPGSPTLAEGIQPENSMADAVSNQGLSFVGLLDPEPGDGGRMSLVGQAWLGSSLLSVETGATAEGLEMRQDRFMLFQDPYG